MRARPSLYRGLVAAALLIFLVLAAGAAAPPRSIHAASAAAGAAAPAATPAPSATAVPTATGGGSADTTLPIDTSNLNASLLDDETSLLQSGIPGLSGSVPLSALPPIKGSVAALTTQIVGLLGRVQRAPLSSAARSALIGQLQNLTLRLQPALDLQDQIATLRSEENVLLQARVDTEAAIDKLSAQVQVTLDKLRVDVQTTVSADVVASVSALTITVSGGADTIQAQLGAQVNRLLLNVLADIDVLHIATLHATANVDTARLNVNLYALVRKLTLDLNLLLTALKVTVRADVAATITAEASLTASLAAEIDGLRADLAANVDAKLGGLDALLTGLINTLNSTLASVSAALQGIQARV